MRTGIRKRRFTLLAVAVPLLLAAGQAAAQRQPRNEPLSFSYTREAPPSDGGVALRASACHVPSDEFSISFLIRQLEASEYQVTLSLEGEDAYRNFTGLASAAPGGAAVTEASFMQPWAVDISGVSTLLAGDIIRLHPTDAVYHYHNVFCFVKGMRDTGDPKFQGLHGWKPFFRAPRTELDNSLGKVFERYCESRLKLPQTSTMDADHYWPEGDDSYDRSIPTQWRYFTFLDSRNRRQTVLSPAFDPGTGVRTRIAQLYEQQGENFLTSGLFYSKRQLVTPARPGGYELRMYGNGKADILNEESVRLTDPVVTYTLPLDRRGASAGSGSVAYSDSVFIVRAATRNIRRMTLSFTSRKTGRTERLSWERAVAGGRPADNVLRFRGRSGNGSFLRPLDISSVKAGEFFSRLPAGSARSSLERRPEWAVLRGMGDIYGAKGFYGAGISGSLFRGSLAAGNLLSAGYREFSDRTPLSLPPQTTGSISLASTGSLSVVITQPPRDLESPPPGDAPLLVSVSGEPLAFSPLRDSTGATLISARELRDACH